ncbi:helix-turn-helix domain-containing protein [Pseudovibrio sp. WM33]|uniref:helix-turn-helix domain-containing protein n=1 Tax=Pseudovibrio sp. WM33 TaxID=1735585 RepID=UPI0007B308A2|nr:helix-turn-helix transcriptional regulator [Pseudovibrio sp. WM33]KZL26063.1 helix-turn-helix protein [Pseudovibrio sp. WM33]
MTIDPRFIRHTAKLSERQMAKELGCAQSTVSRIENGTLALTDRLINAYEGFLKRQETPGGAATSTRSDF